MTALISERAPLAATLDRVAALDAYVSAALLPEIGAGWVRASELLADGAGWLDETLGRIVARYGLDRPKTAASFFVGQYVWCLAGAAVGCLLLDQRVPWLDAGRVAVRLAPGAIDGVALLDAGFAALPGDPAAGQPGVSVVERPEALNELLRRQIEEHMAGLIELVAAGAGLGRRAQWNLAADTCARLFLWLGQNIDQPERGCREGLALIKAPGSPMLPSRTGYLTLEQAGRRETFYLRGACCMTYKIPGAPKCANCPLLPADERERRLRAGMAGA